jgi:hypothetical protein
LGKGDKGLLFVVGKVELNVDFWGEGVILGAGGDGEGLVESGIRSDFLKKLKSILESGLTLELEVACFESGELCCVLFVPPGVGGKECKEGGDKWEEEVFAEEEGEGEEDWGEEGDGAGEEVGEGEEDSDREGESFVGVV